MKKSTILGLFFSCLCCYMHQASIAMFFLVLWVVSSIHTFSKIKVPNFRVIQRWVCPWERREAAVSVWVAKYVETSRKQNSACWDLPWAHCSKSSHAHVVEFHFSWIFSPISFPWNTGLRGWGLSLPCGVCHALRWALAQRGDAECSAKAERDPQLDIDAVLSGKWQEPLLCPRGWAAFRAEEPLSFPSLHQSALGCPTSELRCTLIWDAHWLCR